MAVLPIWRIQPCSLKSSRSLKILGALSTRKKIMAGGSDQIDTVMIEKRLFPPPKEFAQRARVKSLAEYQSLWDEAAADPEKFWADPAREELHWFKPLKQSLI